MCYKKDLLKRERQLKAQIEKLEAKYYTSKELDQSWFELSDQLNAKRLALKTVKSRLNNLNKPDLGMEVFNLSNHLINISA